MNDNNFVIYNNDTIALKNLSIKIYNNYNNHNDNP